MQSPALVMMKVLILAVLVTITLADTGLDSYWGQFKANHAKQYESDLQEKYRRIVWEKNLQYVNRHNLEADLGGHTYRLGMNEYSDLNTKEYKKYMLGYQLSNRTRHGSMFLPPDNADIPTEVDWRKHGYVTNVKNQEQCGSCWAFSATGSLEGQHFKKTGKLVSLSEQNLVDCSKKEGNNGCGGGEMDLAFEYIKKNRGIDTEESYPYEGKDGICRFRRADVGATDTGYVDIPKDDEEALKTAVATVGPIAVAIDAGHSSFQMYRGGVYEEPDCSQTELDHGVLVVGYGEEHGQKFWLVKNSWGESWGLQGYIKMARDHGNMCGIATQASYPLV